jgi:hypothetical protein
MIIRQSLAEAGMRDVGQEPVSIDARGVEAAADRGRLKSPENYVGYERTENFASPGGVLEDVPSLYRTVPALPLDRWSLAGVWTIGGEFATLNDNSGSITYRFHARDLHLGPAPSSQGHPIRFRVKLDGATPGVDHGLDVDAEGWRSVKERRLYQLIRQTGTSPTGPSRSSFSVKVSALTPSRSGKALSRRSSLKRASSRECRSCRTCRQRDRN